MRRADPSIFLRGRGVLRAVVLGLSLAGAALAAAPGHAQSALPAVSADSARATVRETSERVLRILASGAPSDQKLRDLEQVGVEVFDVETVSRLVLARNWKRLSEAQQREFVSEFRKLLLTTYGKRIDEYGDQKVEILADRAEPRGDMTVQTRVVGGRSGEVKVDYRMRPKDGTWLCIDIIVEGVSLVASYRSQFESLLEQGGPDAMLAKIRDKNAKGEGLPAEAGSPSGT